MFWPRVVSTTTLDLNVLATSPVCQFAKKLDYRDRVCFSPGREKANWWRCCCGEQRRQRERCRVAFRTSPETEAQPLNVPLETGVFVSWRQRWWLLVWQVLLTTSSFYLSAVTTTPSPAPHSTSTLSHPRPPNGSQFVSKVIHSVLPPPARLILTFHCLRGNYVDPAAI